MRKERQIAAIERLLATMENGPEPSCVEGAIEVERYVCPERLEAERRVLFRTRPIVVGRDSDLPKPGSFFTHDAAGVPILVTRDRQGRVRAMLNVCRHRGTRLVHEPSGAAKAFVCRYHAWTYDLEGRLGHVPLPQCFTSLDRDASGLVTLPCEVRHGFVWVVATPAPADAPVDVGAWLGDFDDDLAAFDLASHVVFARSRSVRKANWKLVMDAFLEGYHVKSLHQRTLARFFLEDVVVDTSGDHVRSVGARRTLKELAAGPRESWDVRTATTVFYDLFPNGVLVFHPETVSHVSLFPRAIDQVEFVHTMLAPREPRTDEERLGWQRTWELIDQKVFGEEDLAIAESIQASLHSGADTTFRLGALESSIRFFHDAMDRALSSSR